MNDKNLIPNDQRTPSELREISRRGGRASGEARREKKRLTDALKGLLSAKYDVDGEKVTGYKAISTALVKAALEGNVKAYEVIRDTIGEKPTEKVGFEAGESTVKGINITFVDKSGRRTGKESDPKIVGEFTPPLDTGE